MNGLVIDLLYHAEDVERIPISLTIMMMTFHRSLRIAAIPSMMVHPLQVVDDVFRNLIVLLRKYHRKDYGSPVQFRIMSACNSLRASPQSRNDLVDVVEQNVGTADDDEVEHDHRLFHAHILVFVDDSSQDIPFRPVLPAGKKRLDPIRCLSGRRDDNRHERLSMQDRLTA